MASIMASTAVFGGGAARRPKTKGWYGQFSLHLPENAVDELDHSAARINPLPKHKFSCALSVATNPIIIIRINETGAKS